MSLLFGRKHRAHSVTLLWIAYRIGVDEHCCHLVEYITIFHKNGVILHFSAHGSRKDFSRGTH